MKSKSQVWIETVIYTLIGLTIIAIILATTTPLIEKYKDKMAIEQTESILTELNNKIIDIKTSGTGNSRIIPELSIKKGVLEIDYTNNKIIYTLEGTNLQYSQPGSEIKSGDIIVKTEAQNKKYKITLSLVYSDVILSHGTDTIKTLYPSKILYKLYIENKGVEAGASAGKVRIEIAEVS